MENKEVGQSGITIENLPKLQLPTTPSETSTINDIPSPYNTKRPSPIIIETGVDPSTRCIPTPPPTPTLPITTTISDPVNGNTEYIDMLKSTISQNDEYISGLLSMLQLTQSENEQLKHNLGRYVSERVVIYGITGLLFVMNITRYF